MSKKFIKCFTESKSQELKDVGLDFLYEQNGVYYFKYNEKIVHNFSNNDVLKNTQITTTVNF